MIEWTQDSEKAVYDRKLAKLSEKIELLKKEREQPSLKRKAQRKVNLLIRDVECLETSDQSNKSVLQKKRKKLQDARKKLNEFDGIEESNDLLFALTEAQADCERVECDYVSTVHKLAQEKSLLVANGEQSYSLEHLPGIAAPLSCG